MNLPTMIAKPLIEMSDEGCADESVKHVIDILAAQSTNNVEVRLHYVGDDYGVGHFQSFDRILLAVGGLHSAREAYAYLYDKEFPGERETPDGI